MKLLIVDDEPNELAAINEIISGAGYETVPVANVVDAIAYLESDQTFSLILTDLIMPERTGLDLLEYVRFNLRLQKIPVIVFSGMARSESVAKALKFGAHDFMVKPIAAAQLLEKVRNAIASTKRIVLVVSPDPLELELLTKIIEREGHHVVTAFSAGEALEQLEMEQLFAVITELHLPDMSGVNLAFAVKKYKPSLLVLLISSARRRFSHDEAVATGADGVIDRPFKIVEIAEKLRTLDSNQTKNREEAGEE